MSEELELSLKKYATCGFWENDKICLQGLKCIKDLLLPAPLEKADAESKQCLVNGPKEWQPTYVEHSWDWNMVQKNYTTEQTSSSFNPSEVKKVQLPFVGQGPMAAQDFAAAKKENDFGGGYVKNSGFQPVEYTKPPYRGSALGCNRADAADFAKRYGVDTRTQLPSLHYRIRKGKFYKAFQTDLNLK